MAVVASTIINKAEIVLQDTTNVRWAEAELLGWLNDGQKEIVLHKPDASVTTESLALVAGTKQALPTGGIRLIDCIRNMGTNGTTAGNSVRLIDRHILDAQVQDWHSEAAAAVVKHFCFDERNPKVFYVYPQSTATNYLEIVYSSAPADCATVSADITIDDIYQNVLLDYILYRAYQKDADYASNDSRVKRFYAAFLTALGKMDELEVAIDPNNSPSRGV